MQSVPARTTPTDRTEGPEAAAGAVPRRSALIIVQNLPVPLDRRVWLEATSLARAGWDVAVICPRGSDEPRHRVLDGVSIWTYRPAPPAVGVLGFVREFALCWLRTARLSWSAWRRKRFDVIQACNPPDTYWLLALLWRVRGVRFVFDQHDLCPEVFQDRFGRQGPLYRALCLLERATYATADVVVSTNESYREIAVARGGLERDAVAIVRSAPDPETMRPTDPEPDLRRGRRYLAVYLGIMGPQDGVDHLVLALEHYVKVLGRTDLHVALLGFGDCAEDLARLAEERGVAAFCEFTGRADADMIRRWLSSADVGIAPDPPSDFNDRSTMNKVMEYMAYGLPVVMYDLRENRRSAEEAGVVADEATPAALAATTAALLDDPEQRRRRGAAGRRRIEETLRWDRQIPAYLDAFDRAAGG